MRPTAAAKKNGGFDPDVFLATIGDGRKILVVLKKQMIFAQGDQADAIFYVQKGKVRLTVVSKIGKEATIAIVNQGNFFGEGSLAGQLLRMGSAAAMTDCEILRVEKKTMMDALHREPALSEMFVAYLLARNIRYEEDLVDQLFNSSEKRLARVLLLLAHFRQGRHSRNRGPQDQSGDAGRYGGDDSFTCQLLYEPVQEAGIHSLRRGVGRRAAGPQLTA